MTKFELANTIKILGVDSNEIQIDLELNDLFFNTIEWRPEEDKIILHYFEDNIDYEFDYDDFGEDHQQMIYQMISQILLN